NQTHDSECTNGADPCPTLHLAAPSPNSVTASVSTTTTSVIRGVRSGHRGKHTPVAAAQGATRVSALRNSLEMSAHRDQFELDVVGIAEHQQRIALAIVDRRLINPDRSEARLPVVECGAISHHERHV